MSSTKLTRSEKRQKGFLYFIRGDTIPAGAYKAKMSRGGKKKRK